MLANRNGTLVGIPFGAFIRTIGAKNARYTCAIASTRNNLFAGSLIRASISNATLQCGSPAAAFAIAHQHDCSMLSRCCALSGLRTRPFLLRSSPEENPHPHAEQPG